MHCKSKVYDLPIPHLDEGWGEFCFSDATPQRLHLCQMSPERSVEVQLEALSSNDVPRVDHGLEVSVSPSRRIPFIFYCCTRSVFCDELRVSRRGKQVEHFLSRLDMDRRIFVYE